MPFSEDRDCKPFSACFFWKASLRDFFLTFDFTFTMFHKIKPDLFLSGADNKGFVASESDPATTTALPPAPATTVTVTDESAKADAPKEEAKEETTDKKEE